jgi:hypothetical protein
MARQRRPADLSRSGAAPPRAGGRTRISSGSSSMFTCLARPLGRSRSASAMRLCSWRWATRSVLVVSSCVVTGDDDSCWCSERRCHVPAFRAKQGSIAGQGS